jgi:hypothetical protein
MHRLLPRIAAIGTLLTLAACGGSSGSGSSQSLTLSGTVSGLSASGLVLANGSATAPVTSGAATFSFGAVLSSGATYAVTVQTQPTGQACSIASGSGTTGSASITNVAVTCTTPTYSLGGSVARLSAAGLVIANGSDTVTVAAGGTSFTLPTQLVAGSAYSVTVKTQPTNQICSVANGTGTVASANIANVVVTCATEAFAVGGSVSGLTTAGLVLANGSDTVAVAANATAFTLPTQVVTGSSYHVTVQTQPTGEACAVTAGLATMPASAVTSVAVRCTDQPFTLGGTISGLTTAGLVLANGTDTASPAASATSFTMPTPVDFGSSYTLSVATQPTGLTCSFASGNTVTASSGTMPASNVTNTALACSPQAFALDGTVTGLIGSVVLTDGTDTITVSASGSLNFTMPTAIAYGSQYALTVQTQPTGLTCTPGGNSSGAMPASTVTVTVTCSANTYTLGGSISGLTATGLVLANGGGNTVSPASGATTFTLPNGVAFGSTYAVGASTQPSGQTCAVTGASGTMPAANVSSVQVSCFNNTFSSAGAYTWTVPAGVTSIQLVAIGAGGGGPGSCCSQDNNVGGNGALVTSTLSVQPGDVLAIYVGGGGHANNEGGGGGGLTYVGDGATNFLIAGGGGGAGGGPGFDANGGNAGSPGAAYGGANGGGAGSNGVGGSAGTGGIQTQHETAGSAFTDTVTPGSGSGGIGGGCCIGSGGGSGISSTIGNGGTGGEGFGAGGGGGGYGGGGGGADGEQSNGSAGGGGGGSTGPGGTTFAVAPNGGPGAGGAMTVSGTDGSVVITIL